MSIISGPWIRQLASFPSRDSEGKPASLPFLELTPYISEHVGPNSVDVTLAPELRVYGLKTLDCREENHSFPLTIPGDGFIINPGTLYIASTVERSECHGLVPVLNGRSSIGRLGISVHVTAGFGDDGFSGTWTLEITCVHAVRIYAGMRIAQLAFFTLEGERKPYTGRYAGQQGPTASRMHLPTPSSPHGTTPASGSPDSEK